MVHLKKKYKIDSDGEHLTQEIHSILDHAGNETERRVMDGAGNLRLQTLFSYRTDGLLRQTIVKNGRNVVRSSVQLEYDDRKHLVRRSFFDHQKHRLAYHIWHYDEISGVLTEFVKYGPDGKERFRRKYTYDEEGHVIKEEHFGMHGELLIVKTKRYDMNGREERERIFEQGKKLIAQKCVLYNNRNLPIEISWYDAMERIQRLESFDYESDGSLRTEIVLDFHGNHSFFKQYNEYGKIQLIQTKHNGNTTAEETFSYDSAQRLIVRIKYTIQKGRKIPTEKEQHLYEP